MAQRAISGDDFRGLFALISFAARHNENHDGASRLLKLFVSGRIISNDLLHQWSESTEVLGRETVGRVPSLSAHAVADHEANYDHASAFLHAVLKALDERQL